MTLKYEPQASPLLSQPLLTLKGAKTVHGAGRGKTIGIPTINIELSSVPDTFANGVYACWITIDNIRHMGAMHFGPRPVFRDSESFEVHVLDCVIEKLPTTVDVTVIRKIRGVEQFANAEALVMRIKRDIEETRVILGS